MASSNQSRSAAVCEQLHRGLSEPRARSALWSASRPMGVVPASLGGRLAVRSLGEALSRSANIRQAQNPWDDKQDGLIGGASTPETERKGVIGSWTTKEVVGGCAVGPRSSHNISQMELPAPTTPPLCVRSPATPLPRIDETGYASSCVLVPGRNIWSLKGSRRAAAPCCSTGLAPSLDASAAVRRRQRGLGR